MYVVRFETFDFQFLIKKNKKQPSRQNRKIVTVEEGVFVESAFNMQCHIVKNTLLHIAFSSVRKLTLYVLSLIHI